MCDKVVCDKFVCGRMYVTKLFEWAGGSGRADGRTGGRADGRTGGRADGRTGGPADGRTGGRADGLQNPKQEPHTKMWGNIPKVLSETLLKKDRFQLFPGLFSS